MQRKIVNTKYKLHSIPIINKVKSNVLYSIPCVKSCAHFCKRNHIKLLAAISLLLSFLINTIENNNCYAICSDANGWCSGTIGDQGGSVLPVTGTTVVPASASLSLSNTNMTQTATPGSVAIATTEVTVKVGNAESYSLTLKMNDAALKNGNTTIDPGDAVSDNTWGYSWDGSSNYTAPTTTNTSLPTPTLSNGEAKFTKNLTFGVKFANNAETGHYRGSGILSLVATPRAAMVTLANLTQMQQLALAPEACTNTPYLEDKNYSNEYKLTDVRDNNTYTVRKLGDGKCWMTQDLKLSSKAANEDYYYMGGRILNSDTSDVTANWTLPASSTSGFDNDSVSNVYVSGDTGYYTWCAATAGTCSTAVNDNDDAPASICPKGWKLPTGYDSNSGNNDFYNLFSKMGLSISNDLSDIGGTNWQDDDLTIVQNTPYNLTFVGYVYNSSINSIGGNESYWWSRTAKDDTWAYNLYINNDHVSPGTGSLYRRFGFAVRCVAA